VSEAVSECARLGFVLSAHRVVVVVRFSFDRTRSFGDEFRVVNAMVGMP
jgi:hypothetical protein